MNIENILSEHKKWLMNEGGECADLRGADLRYVNLSGADLRGVKINETTIGIQLACPEEGSFIAYKKAGSCIVKLQITEDAKRSSATTLKCRASKALVLDIEQIKTGEKIDSVSSNRDLSFIYEVGKVLEVNYFDENRWNECSTGIHFFLSKELAKQY